jgi:large subunit ribosomal protein L24
MGRLKQRLAGRKPRNKKLHVKKGDKVVVIAGQWRSKEPHEVLQVDVGNSRVTVQGVNLRWKNTRKSPGNPKGERVQKEFPIAASNVLLWSQTAGKGVRVRAQVVDGKRVRVGTCGTRFD